MSGMDAGALRRIRLAGVIAAISAASVVALVLSAPQAGSAPGDQLLPDVQVERPNETYLVKHKNAVRLRFSSIVSNTGAGPLELFSEQGQDGQCNSDADPTGRLAVQRIFNDTENSPDYFWRGSGPNGDTGPDSPAPSEVEAGCMRFHPTHDHWHFDDFAEYTLIREPSGKIVGRSTKVSFCIIDTGQPHAGLPGSPDSGHYPEDPENPKFATCSATSTNGLSIGWEDTYGAGLPGQGINITGRKGGNYCLILEADPPTPERPNGQLDELNEDDNFVAQRLHLAIKRKGEVKRLKGACQAPLP